MTQIYSLSLGENIPDRGFYCCGVHPYYVMVVDKESLAVDYSDPRLVAVGEVGLDFRFAESVSRQIFWFEKQILLAHEHDLPMIIHCVKALPQTLGMLQRGGVRRYVIHGFRGSLVKARQIIDSGGAISFGEALLSDMRLREVARELPLDRLFLESDQSLVDIERLYETLAQLKGVELSILKQEIDNNFKRIFHAKQ
ncbi:MAG: TatD family hydrolase [Rikenellaceae bacterium]